MIAAQTVPDPHLAVIRRCAGSPPLAWFGGDTPKSATRAAWRYCRNNGIFGFRIDLEKI